MQVQLPHYKLMTSEWLYKHSTITKPFLSIPAKCLEMPTDKTTCECVIQAELLAPNTLTTTDESI